MEFPTYHHPISSGSYGPTPCWDIPWYAAKQPANQSFGLPEIWKKKNTQMLWILTKKACNIHPGRLPLEKEKHLPNHQVQVRFVNLRWAASFLGRRKGGSIFETESYLFLVPQIVNHHKGPGTLIGKKFNSYVSISNYINHNTCTVYNLY